RCLTNPHSFPTRRSSDLAPTKVVVKVRARFTVKLLFDPEANELPAFTVHWLFCKVPAAPSVTGPSQLVPASLSRDRLLAARRYRDRKSTRLNSSHEKITY